MTNIYYDNLITTRKVFLDNLTNMIMSELLEQKNAKNNFSDENKIRTIAINASWGMGKSYFAKSLSEKLKDFRDDNFEIKVLEYNAWKNDYFADAMKSIIGELDSQITLDSQTKKIAEKILSNGGKTLFKLIGSIITNKLGIDDQTKESVLSLFKDIDNSSIKEYEEYKKMVNDFKIALSEEAIMGKSFKPKVIIIDELDRCKPDFAIEILETIKHIFDVNNVMFVFLINKDQLAMSASNVYGFEHKSPLGECYFKKFFDLEFNLPEVDYNDFVDSFYKEYFDPAKLFDATNPAKGEINLNRFAEALFLFYFKKVNSKHSIREFKGHFQKFRLIFSCLTVEEKQSLPLLLAVVFYYLYRSCNTDASKTIITFISSLVFCKEDETYPKVGFRIDDKYWSIIKNPMLHAGDISIGLICTVLFYGNKYSYNSKSHINVVYPNLGKISYYYPEKIIIIKQFLEISNINSGLGQDFGINCLFVPIEKKIIDNSYAKRQEPITQWCELKYNLLANLTDQSSE